jgi:heme exporter protein D
MSEFFYMDGYAAYVWSAYGITVLALVILFLQSHRRMRQTEKRLELSRQSPSEARRQRKPAIVRRADRSADGGG